MDLLTFAKAMRHGSEMDERVAAACVVIAETLSPTGLDVGAFERFRQSVRVNAMAVAATLRPRVLLAIAPDAPDDVLMSFVQRLVARDCGADIVLEATTIDVKGGPFDAVVAERMR